jgi:nitroreductase
MTTPNLRGSGQERPLSEVITERRATPSFDGSPVPDEALSMILRAGLEAPNGYNLQPWCFVVVRSAEQKRRLREAAMGQPKVEEAGAVIVCCGDPDAPVAAISIKSSLKRRNMASARSKIEWSGNL